MIQTTTNRQDRKFADVFLVSILEFIAEQFEPEDVFDDKVLEEWAVIWAENNGYEKTDD